MNGNEAIEQFCILMSQVGDKVFKNQKPYDCLCKGIQSTREAVVDECIMKFIADAIHEAIAIKVRNDALYMFSTKRIEGQC